ncbi:MAG TPA: hypothetical protein VLB32_05505 [Candidatus Acidoferrales bacterium]|nr:hypothetical protein [Candidatus Acidoferrales bacterium]
MNAKHAGRVAVIVLVGAGLLWAAEPWKEKPYTEWTQKEVERVAQDSPWAHTVAVLGSSAPGDSAIARSEVSGTKPLSDTSTGQPQTKYVVQWISALTMRQMRIRAAQLAGRENPEESAAILAATPPYHILAVVGPNLSAFDEMKEEGTKAASYLELKTSKKRIAPEAVQFIRQNGRVLQVIIFFPKEAEGAPTIAESETKVEFHCRAGKGEIETGFDLRKMVTRDGKPDL